MPDPTSAVVLRADERAVTRDEGRVVRHCFSFGDHYDPGNVAFGPLRVVNEEMLEPGVGYAPHRHADVEIVTWVLAGVLLHEDSTGVRAEVRPGQVAHLSAGAGVEHTERNGSAEEPVHYVQMELSPSAEQLAADPAPAEHRVRWVEGARGLLVPALDVREGVRLHVAWCDTDAHVVLPAEAALHLHVTRGRVVLDDVGTLAGGDTVRLPPGRSRRVVAWSDAELLVWSLR